MDLKDAVHAILSCKLHDIKKFHTTQIRGRQTLLVELAISIRYVLVGGSVARKRKD